MNQIVVSPIIEGKRDTLRIHITERNYPQTIGGNNLIRPMYVKRHKNVTLLEAWKIANKFVRSYRERMGARLSADRTRFIACDWGDERLLAYDLQRSINGDNSDLYDSRVDAAIQLFMTNKEACAFIEAISEKLAKRLTVEMTEEIIDEGTCPCENLLSALIIEMVHIIKNNSHPNQADALNQKICALINGKKTNWSGTWDVETKAWISPWISPMRYALSDLLVYYTHEEVQAFRLSISRDDIDNRYKVKRKGVPATKAEKKETLDEIFDDLWEEEIRLAQKISGEFYETLVAVTSGKYTPEV